MKIADYLNPDHCPAEKPEIEAMAASTRLLHEAIDRAMRQSGIPYLHPEDPTIQLDLLGSARMIAWQEAKASLLFEGGGCWSELPQVYARYGVETTRRLLKKVLELEHATCAVLTDCGMQACALLFDVLLKPAAHAVLMRQVYNKTRKYLEWLSGRVGGTVSIVDDGDYPAVEKALRKNTALIFAETYTNPLLRAVDPVRLGGLVARARASTAPEVHLIVDSTIASPWAFAKPLLEYEGVDFVVASGTKCLSGQDRDLWGYIASRDAQAMNTLMDLQAMRGGSLDWRRASALLDGLPVAKERFERRSKSSSHVAQFLHSHPLVSEVYHPSLPGQIGRASCRERVYVLV